MPGLAEYRQQKDRFFKEEVGSPLTPQQRETFIALGYFDENPALVFEGAITVLQEAQQVEVPMQTSTGRITPYLRYGTFTVGIEGEDVTLTVYTPPNRQGLFLPFMDGTTGDETYSGGRYLELTPLGGDHYLIDFNLAYNPYCAYNELWMCPIPPRENRVAVPIRAGERKPVGPWVEEDHG